MSTLAVSIKTSAEQMRMGNPRQGEYDLKLRDVLQEGFQGVPFILKTVVFVVPLKRW